MKRLVSVLLYTAVFLIPFGQILQLTVSPGVTVYFIDVVMLVLAGTWLFQHKKSSPRAPFTPFIVLFFGVGIVSLLLSLLRFHPIQVGIGGLYLVRWITYSAIYFVVYEQKNKEQLLKFLVISGVVSALFGLVQYFLYPNLRNLTYLGWDPHEYRVFGTFFDSGFAGIIYVLTIILITYLWLSKTTRSLWLAISGILTYTAFVLTYARSSYLAFLTAFFIISVLQKTYKFVLFSIVLLGLTIMYLPRPSKTSEGVKLERTSTISARSMNYLHTLEVITENPLIGVGFNTLRYENEKRGNILAEHPETSHSAAGSDSSLLFVAATTGSIGLLTYLFFWVQGIRIELSKEKRDKSTLLILPVIGLLFVNSLFLNSLFYIWVMLWVWILFGVSHSTGNRVFIAGPISRNNLKSIFTFRQVKR